MARGRRWWAIGLVTAWAVVLLVAAVWSVHHDQATVREQSDLTQGRQTLDRAVATLVEVAGPGVRVEVQPYQIGAGCRLTVARSGTALDQSVMLTVPSGREAQVLDRLADRLPAGWHARHYPHSNRFFADAGDFVAVRGEVVEPGTVRLTAGTGCRPGHDPELTAE